MFKYRASSGLLKNKHKPNGVFKFYIDGKYKQPISDHIVHGFWITARYEVPPGFHILDWTYQKYIEKDSHDYADFSAEIEWIKITGTSWAPNHCNACKRGVASADQSRCELCPTNYYLNDLEAKGGKCDKCPEDTYSISGAYGVEYCEKSKPCTEDDYTIEYGECHKGERSMTYKWVEPKICTEHNGVSLPQPVSKVVECRGCGRGQFLNGDGTCEYCGTAEYQSRDFHESKAAQVTGCV